MIYIFMFPYIVIFHEHIQLLDKDNALALLVY
jgi:hypothetical protein